jgi:hypothetical protein
MRQRKLSVAVTGTIGASRVFRFGGDGQLGNVGNGSECLASETERFHFFQIFKLLQFRGCEALAYNTHVFMSYAMPIVRYLQ